MALQWRQTQNILPTPLTLSYILQILHNPINNVYKHPSYSGTGRVMGIITLLGKEQFEYFYKTVLKVTSADANTSVASAAKSVNQTPHEFLKILVSKLDEFKIRSGLGDLNNRFYTLCQLLVKILISKINNKKNLITNKKALLNEIRMDISDWTILNSVKTLNSKLVSSTTIKDILNHFYPPRPQIGGNPHLTHLKIDEILDNPVFMDALQKKIAEQLEDPSIHYDFDNARTLLARTPLTTRGSSPAGSAAAVAAPAPVVTAAPAAPAAAPAATLSAEDDLKNKLVERIVAAIDRKPIEIKLKIGQAVAIGAAASADATEASGGSKKKSRTVTIKSDSMPKTVKGLKTRKKLLKKKIRKMNKRIKLNKKRIIKLK